MTEKKQIKTKEVDPIRSMNIYEKLHKAIAESDSVVKKNAGRYKAGAYNDIIKVVKKACTDCRLLLVSDPKWQRHDNGIECIVGIRVVDIDHFEKNTETGEAVYHSVFLGCGHAFTQYKGNDDTAKASGNSFSYAHKYILQKSFSLNIEDSQDSDFNSSNESIEDVLGIN